jgi:hypothetical protein
MDTIPNIRRTISTTSNFISIFLNLGGSKNTSTLKSRRGIHSIHRLTGIDNKATKPVRKINKQLDQKKEERKKIESLLNFVSLKT